MAGGGKMLLGWRWAYAVAAMAAASGLFSVTILDLLTGTPWVFGSMVACAFASLQGLGPGILAAVLTTVGFVAMEGAEHSLKHHELLRISLFNASNAIFMFFAVHMRAALTKAEKAEKAALHVAELHERFVAMVNHDLRNPLNAIKMSIPLLRKNCSEGQAKTLHRLENSANRMHILVNDLLDFARTRHGGLKLEKQNVRLSDICEKALDGRSPRIRLKSFGYDVAALDSSRVAQVIDNLVTNAIQHGKDGPIDVITTGDEYSVRLEVRNHGEVDPAVIPVLFDPFRTGGHDSGSVGLGLFIVAEIAKAHGGAVAVRCEGGTTSFFVTFRTGRAVFESEHAVAELPSCASDTKAIQARA